MKILDDFDRRYKIAVGILEYEGVDSLYQDNCKCQIDDLLQSIVVYDFPAYPHDPNVGCGVDYEFQAESALNIPQDI